MIFKVPFKTQIAYTCPVFQHVRSVLNENVKKLSDYLLLLQYNEVVIHGG